MNGKTLKKKKKKKEEIDLTRICRFSYLDDREAVLNGDMATWTWAMCLKNMVFVAAIEKVKTGPTKFVVLGWKHVQQKPVPVSQSTRMVPSWNLG
jgi:hypothetical protein